jgi:TetR/AcrR family transcriptional regulator
MMKDAIFQATVSVLGKHGVEGLTMDRVASVAEVAKGTLYHYFRSKKDLLQLLFIKTVGPIYQDLAEIVAVEQPAIDKLSSHLRTVLEHLGKNAQVVKLLFRNDTVQGLLQSSQRNMMEASSEHLADIFRQGIAEGVFRPVDPVVLAHLFIGLCRGVLDSWPDLEGYGQRKTIHDLIMNTLLQGIASDRGRGH